MLTVDDLSKNYGDFVAVDRISFSASEGKVFGLLGPNGAGKSTTINCIAGLLKPTSGHAAVAGHDVVRDPRRVRLDPHDLGEVCVPHGRQLVDVLRGLGLSRNSYFGSGLVALNVGSNDNNGDGISDLSDFVAFQASFLTANYCNDLENCDEFTDLADFVTFQALFLNGAACP